MPPELLSYLDYRALNRNVPSAIEEFRDELRRFPRNAVIRVCCAINNVIATWVADFDMGVQWDLVHRFFPLGRVSEIVALGRPVFHRHQLLFVMQEALRYCSDLDGEAGAPPVTELGCAIRRSRIF
jgi:hypothetical protein